MRSVRWGVRWVAVLALLTVLTPGVSLADDLRSAAACAGQEVPPPPDTAEESPAPDPLPIPDEPVGGPELGTCGDLVAGGGTVPAEVTAASFVVADLDTGDVLAVRAPHARHRPASTIKVLTALVALRELDPDDVVDGTAADLAIEGSRAGIGPGGEYTVGLLLAGMLLNSGNDTAGALARALGGDDVTLDAMADTAEELGALDTRPATPSGLDGPGGASSAYDMALLFRAAMDEPLFVETIRTRSVDFPGYDGMPGFELSNFSRFLADEPGALGGKTGFTDAARHTFVGAAERDGRQLVVAIMRGEQQPVPVADQTTALLELGFAVASDAEPLGELVDGAPEDEPTVEPSEPQPTVAAPVVAEPPTTTRFDGPWALAGLLFVAALPLVAVAGFTTLRRR